MLQVGELIKTDSNVAQTWKVLKLLGQGTCCQVYLVQDVHKSQNKAAIKIYQEGLQYAYAHDAEVMLLDLVDRANGPCKNLVRNLVDLDYKEHPCLIQELLDVDLRYILALSQGEGLSLYLIHKLASDILRGLHHLHKSGFVHADIKPTNLMWSSTDSCLKIIDYSLSFHVQDTTIGRIQTQGYRAPECEIWNTKVVSETNLTGIQTAANMDKCSSLQNSSNTETKTVANSKPTNEHIPDISHTDRKLCGVDKHCTNCDKKSTDKLQKNHDTCQTDCCCYIDLNTASTSKTVLTKSVTSTGCNKPSRASDMWSFGCVLLEIFTGSKIFTAATLAQSQEHEKQQDFIDQLIEKLVKPRHFKEESDCIGQLNDLARRLLDVDVKNRLTPDQALHHPFFSRSFDADFRDLCMLPSAVLCLHNIVDNADLEDDIAFQDLKSDLCEECMKYGPVTDCVIPRDGPGKGKVYLAYSDWEYSKEAYSRLCSREYNGCTVILTYYPMEDFKGQIYR